MRKIPFLKPNLVKREKIDPYIDQIDESRIYSNYGPLNSTFEDKVLEGSFGGNGGVLTVNNATTGLMMAISFTKRAKGKYAVMPSFTFAATPLAAIWAGLEPYFIDIDPHDWCMDVKQVDRVINELGDDIGVIVPYAAFGVNSNLEYYQCLQESGIPVVVDAASSFGTTIDGVQFGSGFNGTVVFSFHATKVFCIGEGGLIYCGNSEIISSLRQAGNFGFSSNRESVLVGLNSKLSEYSAAIALATLAVFPEKIMIRKELSRLYRKHMESKSMMAHGWVLQASKEEIPGQFIPILCPPNYPNNDVVMKLAEKEIECRTYFSPPCHQQNSFCAYPSGKLTDTNNIAQRILSLPLWEGMTEDDIIYIVEAMSGI